MEIWIIVPVDKIDRLRLHYRRENVFRRETIGTPQYNMARTHAIFGSSRITLEQARRLRDAAPDWFELHRAVPHDWVPYQDETADR
jgi:hypothetical protein